MHRPSSILLTIAGLLSSPLAAEESDVTFDFSLYGDIRIAHSTGEQSWFDNGLGKTRYGNTSSGKSDTAFNMGELALIGKAQIGWDWQAFAHVGYAPEQNKAADLIEAFIAYAPAPKGRLSWSGRAGLMFPHISRENTGIAWTSPYSITPSAINSWVGEEVKVLGLEATTKLRFDSSDLSLTGAAFGFNDPTGTLIAFRGWALHDYKVGAGSTLPLAPIPSIAGKPAYGNHAAVEPTFILQDPYTNPVLETDDKIGYYASLDWTVGKEFKAGAFWYDNKADPESLKGGQYGWHTRFWNLYGEYSPNDDLTIISQYMTGHTQMGGVIDINTHAVDVNFSSVFILANYTWDDWRVSGRLETFKTTDNSWIAKDNNNESGDSWMLAVSKPITEKSSLFLEYLQVTSDRPVRGDLMLPAKTTVKQWQISYRFTF